MAIDGFTRMIDDGTAFLAQLRQNNTKAWFDPRKDHYEAAIRKPALFFADLLADDLSRLAGQAMKPKVYRIYRDVRFSKDKTPLKTHLHILWSPVTDDPFAPAYFFGFEPGEIRVGFGIARMQGATLTRFRAFVDHWGAQLSDAVEETGLGFSDWGDAPLKKVPKPYEQDHPHAAFLKRKNLILRDNLTEAWRHEEGGLMRAVRVKFEACEPVRDLLAAKLSGV